MGMTSLFSGREANSASVRRIESVRSALARPMMLAMLIRAKESWCQVSPVVPGSKEICREEKTNKPTSPSFPEWFCPKRKRDRTRKDSALEDSLVSGEMDAAHPTVLCQVDRRRSKSVWRRPSDEEARGRLTRPRKSLQTQEKDDAARVSSEVLR